MRAPPLRDAVAQAAIEQEYRRLGSGLLFVLEDRRHRVLSAGAYPDLAGVLIRRMGREGNLVVKEMSRGIHAALRERGLVSGQGRLRLCLYSKKIRGLSR